MQWPIRLADPLLHQGGLKVCTGCAMLQAFSLIKSNSSAVSAPLLALHGAADVVCPLAPVAELLKRGVAATDVTLKTFPEGRHDLMNYPEREEARAVVLAWMRARALPQ